MSLLSKLKQEARFYLEHKLSLIKPADIYTISKGIFRKYLPSNPVIIDCGSHDGSDSIALSRIFPKAIIHSFEPVPEIFKRLTEKTHPNKNINCYPLALGDTNGINERHISSKGSDGSSSLLKPSGHLKDHPDVLFKSSIQVETKKLDTWAKENNINRVDLLWLDMQGFEFQMLNASPNILSTVRVIHTEISTKETYEGVVIYKDLRSWLEDKGFRVLKEAIPKGTDMGNVVFVRNTT